MIDFVEAEKGLGVRGLRKRGWMETISFVCGLKK
jgi:hypothetical protein